MKEQIWIPDLAEIPDWNSLTYFEFEPKAKIHSINSSCSDEREDGIEDKVKEDSKQGVVRVKQTVKNTLKVYAVEK